MQGQRKKERVKGVGCQGCRDSGKRKSEGGGGVRVAGTAEKERVKGVGVSGLQGQRKKKE